VWVFDVADDEREGDGCSERGYGADVSVEEVCVAFALASFATAIRALLRWGSIGFSEFAC
jgi:hypothetical protein